MPHFVVGPVVLEGRLVRLEPLALDHAGPLAEAGADPSIFRWFAGRPGPPGGFRTWVEQALDEQARGVSLPFTTVDARTGRVVGSTRFLNIVPAHLRVEIGSTWLDPSAQRTGLNREAKFLMLRHAFETWHVRRVEFKTHALNVQSRTAAKLARARRGRNITQAHHHGRRQTARQRLFQRYRRHRLLRLDGQHPSSAPALRRFSIVETPRRSGRRTATTVAAWRP